MSFARPILYLSTEVNDSTTAVLEEFTYAPALKDIVVGGDDSLFSAVERIFIFTNGPMGKDNPQRQGLNSAIADGGGPVNIFGGIQTIGTDYSPLWDANVGEWTQDAISKGYRSRLTEEFQILLRPQGLHHRPDGQEVWLVRHHHRLPACHAPGVNAAPALSPRRGIFMAFPAESAGSESSEL